MRYEDMEYENYVNIFKAIATDLTNPSRADIAKYLSLSRTAVSTITNSLIAYHLVEESKGSSSIGRGRPGCPLQLNQNYWRVIGASFMTDAWEFVICDLAGNIKNHLEIKVDNVTPKLLVDTLINGIKTIQKDTKLKLIPAIGIGTPGVIDKENGDILFAHDLNWTESFNITDTVEKETGFKAFIMNRYSLEGVAAYKFGNPDRIKDFLYIGVGSGIRSAIYSDGKLINGASFSAGRISHIPIMGNKRKCSCGRTGCLITVANSKALMEYAQMDIEINQLRMLADKGDIKACQAYDKIAEPLTEIITTLLDLLDPKMVVLGGPVGNSQYLISTINSKLSKAKSDRLHTGILVQKESFEYSASAIGASSLVADRLLEIIFKTVKENKGQARSNL